MDRISEALAPFYYAGRGVAKQCGKMETAYDVAKVVFYSTHFTGKFPLINKDAEVLIDLIDAVFRNVYLGLVELTPSSFSTETVGNYCSTCWDSKSSTSEKRIKAAIDLTQFISFNIVGTISFLDYIYQKGVTSQPDILRVGKLAAKVADIEFFGRTPFSALARITSLQVLLVALMVGMGCLSYKGVKAYQAADFDKEYGRKANNQDEFEKRTFCIIQQNRAQLAIIIPTIDVFARALSLGQYHTLSNSILFGKHILALFNASLGVADMQKCLLPKMHEAKPVSTV